MGQLICTNSCIVYEHTKLETHIYICNNYCIVYEHTKLDTRIYANIHTYVETCYTPKNHTDNIITNVIIHVDLLTLTEHSYLYHIENLNAKA